MRLRRTICTISATIASVVAFGQINHVLNYSFEKETICTIIGNCSAGGPITNWYSPSAAFGNWFSNPCFGSSAPQGVPGNDVGYQFARTGQCYAGIEPIGAGNVSAYITGTLADSLKANKKYCVTFYVSLADSEWWATNSIGAYFSNDSICAGNNYDVLPYTPQIENPATNFITDKIHWVPVSGEFQANGGEIFITIGGYNNTTPSDTDSVGHGGFVGGENSEVQSYYYVDDVYVRELTIANAGKDDTICNLNSVLIGKDTTTTGVSFHWLPTTGLSNPNIAQPMASPSVTTTYTLTVINDSIHGCNCPDSVTIDSITVHVNPCLGIDEITDASGGVSIYPNPTTGVITIQSPTFDIQSAEIEVYNVLGEKVLTGPLLTNSINISNQPDGIYLIRVITNEGVLVGQSKIVKEE